MDRRLVVLLAVVLVVIVGGAMLLIGILRGDDTSVDPNGVNSAPVASAASAMRFTRTVEAPTMQPSGWS